MKRLIFSLIAAASVLMTAYSCQEVSLEDATGYLDINVGTSNPGIIYVKGAQAEDGPMSLKIYDNVDVLVEEIELVKGEGDKYTAPAGTIELRTGYYHAVASLGETPETGGASFDSPVYSGETDFTIKRGQTVTLDMECKLSNIKVSVVLDNQIIEKFSEYRFTVTGNDGSTLEYNQDLDNFSRDGYFPATATKLDWELKLVSKTGVSYKSIKGSYDNVKPRQHYKFNFTLVEEEVSTDIGGSVFIIVLDDSLNQKDYELNLDFGKKNPVISSGELDLSRLEHYTGDPCSVSVSSESAIQSLTLSHEDNALETAGLSRTVELVGAGQELLSQLAGIGIATGGIVTEETGDPGITPQSASFDFSAFLSSLPVGRYSIRLNVTNESGSTETIMNVNVLGKRPSVTFGAVSVNAWAMFVNVSVSYEENSDAPEGFGFKYKASDAVDWTDVDPSSVVVDGKTVTAEICGLQPSKDYVVKAVCSDTEGAEASFTTESAALVPNLDFDDWYQDGKIWYPNLDLSVENYVWDTANGSAKVMSTLPIPTIPEESIVVSGKAAKLESKKAPLVGLAAGNIYTGKFVEAIVSLSAPGARLDWGIAFESRPLALKGHYHYLPVAIDVATESYNDMKGKTDIGQIQIILTDRSEPFHINTKEGTFVNVNTDESIIGYGTIDLNETSGYQSFMINVEYRDLTKKPKYIVIVASSSKYGDYFTGGIGSTLYLDEFELVYNPDELNN